jgi:hypothetical protein
MKEVKIKAFLFSELETDKAKETAAEWMFSDNDYYIAFCDICEDAKNIGLIITEADCNPIGADGKFLDTAEKCAKNILEEHSKRMDKILFNLLMKMLNQL